jgi:hypothetical protein
MTAGNQKALRQQCLDNQRADMLSRYPMGDLEVWLLSQSEDTCLAALAPAISELLPLLVVDPLAALEKMREHLRIKPKPNPPGRPLDPLITEGVGLAKQRGMTNAQICRELKIPKEEQHTFKSSMRTRLGTLQPDEQAAIRKARALHKVPRATARKT